MYTSLSGIWNFGKDLLQARDSHRSIVNGNEIMHIGGMNDKIIIHDYNMYEPLKMRIIFFKSHFTFTH